MRTALVTVTLFMTLTTLAACAFDDQEDLNSASDTGASARITADESVARNSSEADVFDAKSVDESVGSCGFSDPPRCSTPRNCVAWCVSCLYDVCRIQGRSCDTCKDEMEECKDECPDEPTFGQ